MLSIPDRILRSGLSQEAQGTVLAQALRTATVTELGRSWHHPHLACGPGCWRHDVQRWRLRIENTRHRTLFNATADDCMRWVFCRFRDSSSPMARDVACRLDSGACPTHAVRGALVLRDQDRVRHNMPRLWCSQARRLYRPHEVLQSLRASPFLWTISPPRTKAALLANWVHSHVQYVEDFKKWGRADYWQSPALTLALGTGDCEDSSLVVWSALAFFDLPRGRLAIGTMQGEGHAWVELPTLGLLIESTSGKVKDLPAPGYVPWMYVYPNGECRLTPR